MATYSTSLKLTLIGDGEQSGTWGQTTNTNLGTLLEQAITGVVTVVHPDTATYSLTNLNGVSDEARNAVLVITGALTAQRDVIAPAVEKLYTIKNSTTGGFAIRIKTSGGTAVTVPNGAVTLVYCDGTDFYTQINSVVGPLTITGNASIGGTLGVTGALSGTTGVFSGAISSVSPSFTGVPTAPTAIIGTNTTQLATTAFVQGALGTLGTMASQNANNVNISGGSVTGVTLSSSNATITGGSISGITDLAVADGGTGASTASGARTNLGLGSIATQDSNNISISGGSVTGVTLSSGNASFTGTPTAPTAANGTNTTQIATTAFVQTAVTGATGTLGTMATQNANNVAITGGSLTGVTASLSSPLDIASGGTNASTAANARTNLGLGSIATQNANSVSISGGSVTGVTFSSSNATITGGAISGITDLAVADGGTGASDAATARTNLSLGTSNNVQFSSLGIGTAASGTAGEIRATNNITAYYSSDIKFKENVKDIDNALQKVTAIGGKYFDWKDDYIKEHGGADGYFVTKSDFGVIAQDVQAVFPVAVRTKPDGTLAVDYEKLCALAFEAIKDLAKRIAVLENK